MIYKLNKDIFFDNDNKKKLDGHVFWREGDGYVYVKMSHPHAPTKIFLETNQIKEDENNIEI